MSNLVFEPLIPPTLWTTLAIAAAAVLVVYISKPPSLVSRVRWAVSSALLICGTLAILTVLLNPTWIEPDPPPPGRALLTVLVDESASMKTADLAGGRKRFEGAAELAREVAENNPQFDVRVRTFSDKSLAAEIDGLPTIEPNGQISNLAAAVSESLIGGMPQGQALLVLSDGAHNASGGLAALLEAARTAKAMAAPIYTKTFGGATSLNDLEVSFARSEEIAFIGQTIPVAVQVRQRGNAFQQVHVTLLQDGREIAAETVSVQPDSVSQVQFKTSQATSGLYRYQARIRPEPNEVTTANNVSTLSLRVVSEPIRVLLLEGKPYWDTKFLVRTLAADRSLELDCAIRLTDDRFLKRSLTLPPADDNAQPADSQSRVERVAETKILNGPAELFNRAEGLADYQVVILGRDAEVFLQQDVLERLRTWISRDGGSLVCYRGSPVARIGQDLSTLLPVRWTPDRESRHRVHLTVRGQLLNWLPATMGDDGSQILSKLPSLATGSRPDHVKPLALVLAESDSAGAPAMVTYQPYGIGRVVTVEGAGMWRWAFLSPEFSGHDNIYATLWQSLLRWLVSGGGLTPGQNLLLRTDKTSYIIGEPVTATLLMREEPGDRLPQIHLRTGNSEPKTFAPAPLGEEPGVYQVMFGALEEGEYVASIGDVASSSSTESAFDVRPFLGEQLDVEARPDILARIAADSGGLAFADASPPAIVAAFQEHITNSASDRVQRKTAWDRWWILVGVFGVWGTAWSLRRAGGLI